MMACHHRPRVAAIRHLLGKVRTADHADPRTRQDLLEYLAHEPKSRLDALGGTDHIGVRSDEPIEFVRHLPERSTRHGDEHDVAGAEGIGQIRGRMDVFRQGVSR